LPLKAKNLSSPPFFIGFLLFLSSSLDASARESPFTCSSTKYRQVSSRLPSRLKAREYVQRAMRANLLYTAATLEIDRKGATTRILRHNGFKN
jgi:hypothetical protein